MILLLKTKIQSCKIRKVIPFLIFFVLIFTGCQTTSQQKNNFSVPEELILSAENQNFTFLDSGTFSVYLSKIDLNQPDLQLTCKINTEDFFTLEDFAKECNLTYAINTTQFSVEKNKTSTIIGVTKFNNVIYTPPVERYSALGFYYNQEGKIRAKIIQNQTDKALEAFPAAFGGFFTILKDSEILEYKNTKHARTACGIDNSGRYLYILTVTSKKLSGKSGLSFMDCAAILQACGCTDALEFDGGHSTALVSPETGYIHTKKCRKIPAALGFFAN